LETQKSQFSKRGNCLTTRLEATTLPLPILGRGEGWGERANIDKKIGGSVRSNDLAGKKPWNGPEDLSGLFCGIFVSKRAKEISMIYREWRLRPAVEMVMKSFCQTTLNYSPKTERRYRAAVTQARMSWENKQKALELLNRPDEVWFPVSQRQLAEYARRSERAVREATIEAVAMGLVERVKVRNMYWYRVLVPAEDLRLFAALKNFELAKEYERNAIALNGLLKEITDARCGL
jgi:hypothetical protein